MEPSFLNSKKDVMEKLQHNVKETTELFNLFLRTSQFNNHFSYEGL